MRLARIIERRIRKRINGVDLATDATAAVAANVGERGATSHASTSQRIVQRSETTRRPTDAENE